MPPSVSLGPFVINQEKIREALRKDLDRVVLDYLARRTSQQSIALHTAFEDMHKSLMEKPLSIEDAVNMREYLKTLPVKVQALQPVLDGLSSAYGVLEKFRYELAKEDDRLRWVIVGWPYRLDKQRQETNVNLDAEVVVFSKRLQTDQEGFGERIHALSTLVVDFAKTASLARLQETLAEVQRISLELKECQQMASVINARERLFDLPVTPYEEVQTLAKDFEVHRSLWVTVSDWAKLQHQCLTGPFIEIDFPILDKKLADYQRFLKASIKKLVGWAGCVEVATSVEAEIAAFKTNLPLIGALRHPGMTARHWEKLNDVLGTSIKLESSLTLNDLLKLNLENQLDSINNISAGAAKEYEIEKALDRMDFEWSKIPLVLLQYKESGTSLVKIPDEVVRLLDDHLVLTQTLEFQKENAAFKDRILLWAAKLRLVQEVVDIWLAVQRNWLYLEPIFSSDDIVTQLPAESKRFTTMDRTWRRIITSAKQAGNLADFCADSKLLDTLKECHKILEVVQKGLSRYLESKRKVFPRFNFLSDDELLQILSQSKDPLAVQPHLRKCFENIASLDFGDKNLMFTIISGEGERIGLQEPFYPTGPVEEWLTRLEDQMYKSVKKVIMESLANYHTKPRNEWVTLWPGQAVIAGSLIHWTRDVTEAINAGPVALKTLYSRLLQQLEGLVALVRGELPSLARLVLGDLIVIDVHSRDVVKKLVDCNISSEGDYEWISQLRYYWEQDDLKVRIMNATFNYGYEYLGNTGRLVITPLTDRCYLTLTGALHMGMGGAPAGPAGTGKTETVKDLAKALAKQCVVFNCSDQLDYLAMGKFFKGLASSGAWACFDEFNRIDIEVLSVVAQQILTCQKAAASGLPTFMFEGQELKLNPTFAVFITMNPGYAGRTELPDNLKALFRPVAMMIPNYAMISEIMLFSFGLISARPLAEKGVATFKLASEQLSSQDHYDFGMRAVKSVISAAGNLKRQQPNAPEEQIMLRALMDCNLPKFLEDDVPLFMGIISDLFPGIQFSKPDYGNLQRSLIETCQRLTLQPEQGFIDKCLQLYETATVRHGLMLVGPPGGGKTTCCRVLAQSISTLAGETAANGSTYHRVRVHVLNPKSITMGQLYGEFDPQTHEWSDGIFSSLMRRGVEDATPDRKWYVFDGPVDAVWIETMNTLLDDNKKLCLTSGEIIKMSPLQTIMFEVADLAYASPATVSRCGMIYMDPVALGIKPLVSSWIYTQERQLQSSVAPVFTAKAQELFEYWLTPSLDFLKTNLRLNIPTSDGHLTSNLTKILYCFITPFMDIQIDNTATDDEPTGPTPLDLFKRSMDSLFIFSLIWSVGAAADQESRPKFNAWMREKLRENMPLQPIPEEGSVFDYLFDQDRGAWIHWTACTPEFHMDPKANLSEVIVPTVDTIRNTYLLHLLLHHGCHVLVTGPTGTGKSATIQDKLLRGMDPTIMPVQLNFSARTSANQIQDILDGKMEKRRKGVFGPPVGRRYVIFIDDLNMPALDICGAQPPVELLRQWMDCGGWYDRTNIGQFKEISDLTMVAAMGPPGGGRNPVTPRFTRHFNLLPFVEMDDASLHRIFGTILGSTLEKLDEDVRMMVSPIVKASVHVYNRIRSELLPTPAKSHYTFNLRDLSKVIIGVASTPSFSSATHLTRTWANECLRVFSDRLVDDADKTWFVDLLKITMKENLPITYEEAISSDPPNLKQLVKVAEEYLEDFNSTTTSPMRLVMFADAIEHISRIRRIIRQPGGHALLLGVGGSGRQSLSRLATFMEEMELFQIEISKSYGINEWKDDLKKVLSWAGLESKPTVFLYTDTQIISEACLEDVNNILNGGDVPNIYTTEEADRILSTMRPIANDLGIAPTKENLHAIYISRVRQNLHLIICMSPVGDAFRTRLRMFPSLVNCCTIDWFATWPEDALQSVAANAIAEINDLGSEQIIDGVVNLCVLMHESVRRKCIDYKQELNRHNHVTPKSYLELLSLYKGLLGKKRAELAALRKRTSVGLEKLLNATKEVELLQEELEAMQPMLLQTSQETEYAMKRIAADKVQAEEIRATVAIEEAASNKKAEETKAIADDAKRDLDEALPALDAALESLNSLSKTDIIEIRSMQRPPEGVKLVIEAVCLMKNIKPKKVDGDKLGKKVDDYWEPGKALLADPQKFLDSLINFEKDNISETTIQKIKPYIDSPEFQVSVISRVSKAATSMCAWVRAMEKYYWVSRSVAPKRARLQEAQASLDATLKLVADLKKQMRESEINIKEMEKRYDESLAKKEELSKKVEECNVKLVRAGKLITGLSDEKGRWAKTIEQLDIKIHNITGDILLAAGAIAYLGPFTAEYRQDLLTNWSDALKRFNIPHTHHISLFDTLGDSVKLREWELHGLPKDFLSRDNAIIVQQARRWPLFIDPQGQANKWIRNMEKENGLEVVKLTDRDLIRSLENAVRFGKPVLLENVQEKLDPALDPILLQQTYRQGASLVIKLGDTILPYNADFRLYLTTPLPNPAFSPELAATLTLVNFTLAGPGLEDQLLAIVVANERPDLEEAKTHLTAQNAQMRRELKEIEDKILYLLSSVQGSPVDDERLIDTLAASKETSEEIQRKVIAAEATEKEIDTTRNKYAPVAVRTRVLFFCITELAAIDPMYQYSLAWFMALFTNAINRSEKSDNVEKRVLAIIDHFTFSLFENVCRSLFERHKLLFSFLLLVRIEMNDNRIDPDEWRFLLSGVSSTTERRMPNPAPDWLSANAWTSVLALSSLPAFNTFSEDFVDNVDEFRQRIFDSSAPHKEPLPGRWSTTLTPFQKLLPLKCLRPDKMLVAISGFVCAMLGQRFVEPSTTDMVSLFKESTPTSPLIFVLSPGADPATALYKFAEEMRFTKRLLSVSLGQGQGPRAEALIKEGAERGLWVLLQNCHLSPSWMPRLERLVTSMSEDPVNIHRDFRLWLTSTPTSQFPSSILRSGVKTTMEAPSGLKANLVKTFTEDIWAGGRVGWRRLVFAMSFLHAILVERKRFGSLGYNIPYEFTDGDLRVSVQQANHFFTDEKVPWTVLQTLVADINYGGRVTDDWDRRLVHTLTRDFVNPAVLNDNHQFDSNGVYICPSGDTYQDVRNYLRSLPTDETTDIFGMNENASITFAQREASTLFETLLALSPKASPRGATKSREEVIAATVTTLQEKIPSLLPSERQKTDYGDSYATVVSQEVLRYNRLLKVIRTTLAELDKALKGLVVMSQSLEETANAIYQNQLPPTFAAVSYPTVKPLSGYITDLVARTTFLSAWQKNGPPAVFWISGLFFPQSFLTATLQNYARKYVIPIDTLSFDFKIVDMRWEDIGQKPGDGAYIRGLYLEGARWDGARRALAESRAKELYTELSVIWLLPKQNRRRAETGVYLCPVYKTGTRAGALSTTGHSTNFVLSIELPTDKPESHWVKRGVAAIMSLGF
ncbi:dynein heavy chain and region D6 of dynein motor-domain-containing protein [Gaertneriomyces semiglobifer]|nr:dynein heavy chain and region D6 of dynein motor-domain-containing protein [Gaertneriomyces semiglobifer]